MVGGDYPESIDLLVPEFLEAVPLNSLDNAPIALEYLEVLLPEGEPRKASNGRPMLEFNVQYSDTAQGLFIY